jgi:PilZ domain
MGHDWSDDILVTRLSPEPQTSDELHALTAKLAIDMPKSDLLVDLGALEEPTYQTLCRLTALSNILSERGCCCMFYNLSAATRRMFTLYGFDRIFQILDSSEIILTPSPDRVNSGILKLHSSKERRRYSRLRVPSWSRVDVLLWHGGRKDDYHKLRPGHSWIGRLVDISEGGIQVAIDATEATTLGKGRLVGLEFRPTPAKPVLAFDAQIREILPTADGKSICLGLQFTGLEANPEGCQGLQMLCNSAERIT